VLRPAAWGGALGALALLWLFIAVIGYNLARGRTPDCHCFGQFSSTPVGWPTLVRNGVLAAIAGVIVWHGPHEVGPSAIGWLSVLTPAQRIALGGGTIVLGLLAAQGWVLLHLLRQHGRLLLRMDALEARLTAGGLAPLPAAPTAMPGLPIGTPAPGFRLTGLYGETLTLDALRAPGQPVLLIFTDPHCSACTALLPEVGRWQREHAAQLTLALISQGTVEANRAKVAAHGVTHVLLQEGREAAQAYQAAGTPTAVLVRPDGTIGSPLAPGTGAIAALVAQTVGQPVALPILPAPTNGRCPHCGQIHGHHQNGHAVAPVPSQPPAVPIGAPAPALRFPDLTGTRIDLTAFRGHPTLVLFWNPGCGFCQQMLPDLQTWEANPPPEAPRLLVVSAGTVEANQAQELRSPVVLDQDFSAGRAFGATGTPSAVLVDAQGHIASPVAVGAAAVLALAAGPAVPQHGDHHPT
jgi:peroxiredoxin